MQGGVTRCIWCKEVGAPSREHIIPEALGCPNGFVLSEGVVCRACNNGLGHLDQAVIDDFDLPAYMSGVPRKNNRAPAIRSRGNMIGTSGPDGKEISINMERFPVKAHDGTRLGAFGNSVRNVQASFEQDGRIGKISFSVSIGQNLKFVRGIVKIGLSSLAYFLGPDLALSEDFDPIRDFVRQGKGVRPVFLKQSTADSYSNKVWPPYQSETGEYAVTFRLAIVEFLIDLSPNLTNFQMFKDQATKMYGDSGWTYLPNDF